MTPWIQYLLSGALGFALCGCRTPDGNFAHIIDEPKPVAEELRASFGTMGVLPMRTAVHFNFAYPPSSGDVALASGVGTFVWVARSTANNDDADFEDTMGTLAFGALLAGSAAIVGGVFAGVSEGDMRRAERQIQQALKDLPLEHTSVQNRNCACARRPHFGQWLQGLCLGQHATPPQANLILALENST